jgi:hypothetical protein
VRPGVWQTQDLTAQSGAPEAVLGGIAGYVSRPDGTQHVVYISKLGTHVVDLWRDVGGWHYKDLSAVTSARPPDWMCRDMRSRVLSMRSKWAPTTTSRICGGIRTACT